MIEQKSQEDIPETLYHYCNVEAFLNIVEQKSIWLSSVLEFNDYMETKWILPIIKQVTETLKTDQNTPFFNDLMQHYNESRPLPFMACFSEKGDILSQWRAYAADGCGFAIGLNTKVLATKYGSPLPNIEKEYAIGISEVIYNKAQQHSHIIKTLEHFIMQCVWDDENCISIHANECASILQKYSLIFKNPKFVEELEWRIIYTPLITHQMNTNTLDLRFRAHERAIVPYFELPLSRQTGVSSINEIILGPKNNTDPFVIDMLLKKNGFDNVHIDKSEASYR